MRSILDFPSMEGLDYLDATTNMKLILYKRNESAVDYVRALLARCESGEVVAVTTVEELKGGTYVVLGSTSSSRTQTAGMLLDAAIQRLAAGE